LTFAQTRAIVKTLFLFKMDLNVFLLEFVMRHSKTFCFSPSLSQLPHILLVCLLLTGQLGVAQTNDLVGGDMGLPPSSKADNNLIDADSFSPPTPAPTLSPAEAAELVRNKVGGQVMSVNTRQDDTGVVYGVKVLNAGRMRVINIDGQTGQLLNQ
jgi:hypothetical protein